ncbi:MAG: metallophosphoesterase family protein [Pleurocapsa sp. SU_196_0]|nr:metallophosphoesterase family protein [Pleurocapsa sp. SU_196_0]
MKLGVLSDVHGNIHALRAAWQKLQDLQCTHIVCLGDLVGYGASPIEVIEFIRDNDIPTTLGASEARLLYHFGHRLEPRQGVADQTLEWTKTQLSDEHFKFMKTLPMTGRLQTPHGRVKYMHGMPDDPEARIDLSARQSELDPLLEDNNCTILITGCTHIPQVRQTNRGWFINPGSVGLTLNGEPGADCAVINLETPQIKIDLLKVPYNTNAAAFDILTWELPAVIADVIKPARVRDRDWGFPTSPR